MNGGALPYTTHLRIKSYTLNEEKNGRGYAIGRETLFYSDRGKTKMKYE
jgi:hypothetical protein